MKLVLISDTHNLHRALTSRRMGDILPDGDLLIHTGDFSGVGNKGEVLAFIDWCQNIVDRYTHGIVFIAGNHDKSFDPRFRNYFEQVERTGDVSNKKPIWLQQILSDLELSDYGITYLENSSVEIEGIKIWGSPITPWFHGDRWGFNKYRGPEIKAVWDEIPQDADIVLTHGPVAYKLDYVPYSMEYVGCEDLKTAVHRVKPLIHVSGHIHEGYGYDYDVDTHYFNASICDQWYDPKNKPWEVEVDWKNRDIQIKNNGTKI